MAASVTYFDLVVVDLWCNASSLHSCRNGENHHVESFSSWFKCSFGYLLDPDSITRMNKGKLIVNSGQFGLLDSLMNIFYSRTGGPVVT